MGASLRAVEGTTTIILPDLPVVAALPRLRSVLFRGRGAVLHAPPGAGKSTLVPLALLEESWLVGQRILILEPRRLAARAVAGRMAQLLGESVGETVGYRIRFEQRISPATRVEVLTEGILTRRLQTDPELAGVGLVIYDEFHERSLNADLALALGLEVATSLRNDLRLLVMSATLEVDRVNHLLQQVGLVSEVISSPGQSYPVAIHYLPRDPTGDPALYTAEAVRHALQNHPGDILAFLPGSGEIRRAQARLAELTRDVVLHPLYGDLPQEAQDQAIRPDNQGRRKVVLATSLAQTSLTIEGIGVVVDSGLARLPRFDPKSGLTRLDTVPLAQDGADQRAGRAGRLRPGVCLRLWRENRPLLAHTPPEILAADLAPLALELAQWGADPATLPWLDPPPPGALAQAQALLKSLEALDESGRITLLGQRMIELPVHPRLARMLLQSQSWGLASLPLDVAALLSGRDVLRSQGQVQSVDLGLRLAGLSAFRRGGRSAALHEGADPSACAQADATARQLERLLNSKTKPAKSGKSEFNEQALGKLLVLAYPDRVAGQREGSNGRYRLAGGRGAKLPLGDPLSRHPYLAVAHLDGGGSEGVIYLAAPLALADLRQVLAHDCRHLDRLAWDSATESVVARREERLGELLLDSRPLHRPDPDATIAAMLEGIGRLGLAVLPWTTKLRDWQARVLCVGEWRPLEGWPDVSDETLLERRSEWLGPFLTGLSRRDHLSQLDLETALTSQLNWEQRQALEQLAPSHCWVPSGSRHPLCYTPGLAPVLAVKLQELFGLADTPRVADGQVPVTLHLLSPARRPIQVTSDLRSFWERTYPEVKKELKGRYPKHPWPDDPWTAPPTARPKPRG